MSESCSCTLTAYQDISFIGDGVSHFLAYILILGGTFQIISGVAGVVHQGEEVIIHSNQLVVFALDIRHFHVVSRGTDILKFLSCKKEK